MNIFFLGVVVVYQAIVVITHVLLYKTLILFVPGASYLRTPLFWSLMVLSFSFLIGTILVRFAESKISNIVYKTAAVWMGTFFWLLMAVIIINIVFVFFYNTMQFKIFATLLLLSACLLSAYGMYTSRQIKIKEYTVAVQDLPEIWHNRRAGFFADSHYGAILNKPEAQKIASLIASQNVELLFMSGDFFDGPATDFVGVGQQFKDLRPKYGKYFVTGNHEEYAGIERALKGIEAGGFTVTDRKMFDVEGVQILGVPYEHKEDENGVTSILEKIGLDQNKPSIVLKHVPNDLEALALKNVSLVLSGHTHRGQIWPFSLLTKKVFKGFDYGLNTLGQTQVITTSGSGSWGPPQRIGTQSELVVITFVKK